MTWARGAGEGVGLLSWQADAAAGLGKAAKLVGAVLWAWKGVAELKGKPLPEAAPLQLLRIWSMLPSGRHCGGSVAPLPQATSRFVLTPRPGRLS